MLTHTHGNLQSNVITRQSIATSTHPSTWRNDTLFPSFPLCLCLCLCFFTSIPPHNFAVLSSVASPYVTHLFTSVHRLTPLLGRSTYCPILVPSHSSAANTSHPLLPLSYHCLFHPYRRHRHRHRHYFGQSYLQINPQTNLQCDPSTAFSFIFHLHFASLAQSSCLFASLVDA